MWGFLIVSLFTFVLLFLFIRNERHRHFFKSKGLPYKGNVFYNMIWDALHRRSFLEGLSNQYNKLKASGFQVSGGIEFGKTSLFIRDPDLVKLILVKDFDHFTDHMTMDTGRSDYLLTKMLVVMTGERWKHLRAKLSPTFTTGKIKRMFRLFDESGKKFTKFLESEIQDSGNSIPELAEAYSKFTMDIIASAACGIDSQAFNQKSPSIFETNGKKLQFDFGGKMILIMIALTILPVKVCEALGISFLGQDVQEFFSSAIKSSIKQRLEKGERREDFIQLMLEARQGTLKTDESELEAFEKDAMIKENNTAKVTTSDLLDDDGVVANCVLFILAGFDTTQSLLLFSAYELALNPHVQDKLRAEINASLDENDGQFTYDGLSKIAYLDMVIQETLRLFPPAPIIDRQCVIEYPVPGTDFTLKKGDIVIIPVHGFHHDADYFPEPEKFIPERFSAEKKSKINQYVYLPFGQGPRNCIGMRFALMEAKVVISYLVRNFTIEPSAETPIPIKFKNSSSLKPSGKLHLKLTKIQH